MAEGGVDGTEEVVSFKLLPSFDLEGDEIDVTKLTQEQQDVLQNLMDTLNIKEHGEINNDENAFEQQSATFRHASCSAEQVDFIAGKSIKDATHWQTKWTVNVYRGKMNYFQSNFCKTLA